MRITNNSTGHVFYAQHNGGADRQEASVHQLRRAIWHGTGASKIEVVANGIPSKAADITIN